MEDLKQSRSLSKLTPLKKGDHIALIAPASFSPKLEILLAAKELKKLGFVPHIAKNAFSKDWFFSGRTEERAATFMDAWKNPDIKALWAIRGGYGSSKILDYLDFSYLKKYPKILIGMSDITALHVAFEKEVDYPTFLGPNALQLLTQSLKIQAKEEKKDFQKSFACFFNMLMHFSGYQEKNLLALQKGDCTGKIVGGNLSVIASLLGTKYQLDTAGKILVLEEVNEKPYRVDRLFNQLQMSGSLDSIKGFIFGDFAGIDTHLHPDKAPSGVHGISPATHQFFSYLKKEYLSKSKIPILAGLKTGHIQDQWIIPLHTHAKMINGSIEFSLSK